MICSVGAGVSSGLLDRTSRCSATVYIVPGPLYQQYSWTQAPFQWHNAILYHFLFWKYIPLQHSKCDVRWLCLRVKNARTQIVSFNWWSRCGKCRDHYQSIFCFIQNIHTENVYREILTQSYRENFGSSPYLTFVAQLSSVYCEVIVKIDFCQK